jgi:hypothetical protein
MLELRALCIHDSEQALQNQQHKLVQYAKQLEQSGHTHTCAHRTRKWYPCFDSYSPVSCVAAAWCASPRPCR